MSRRECPNCRFLIPLADARCGEVIACPKCTATCRVVDGDGGHGFALFVSARPHRWFQFPLLTDLISQVSRHKLILGSGTLVVFVTVVFVALVSARRATTPRSVFQPLADSELHSVPEIVRQFDGSVCRVETPTGSGTGFVVGANLVATNEHVIRESRAHHVVLAFAGDTVRGVTYAFVDREIDLAVLHIAELPNIRSIPLHSISDLQKGEDIVIIGCPGGLQNVVTKGAFGSIQDLDGRRVLQLSASVNPGNSGGPVLTLHGKAAGIVTLKSLGQEGIGYAVPCNTLAAAIQAAVKN